MRAFLWGFGALVSTIAFATNVPVRAELRLHPENPRYFEERTTGAAVLIAGYGSIVPSDSSYDYAAGIDELRQNGIHYARVWHLLPWSTSNAIWPWARSNVAGAYLGGNKYDLERWNTNYWTRLTDSLARSKAAGIYAEIHLFDRVGLSPAEWERYGNNPWASNNNINDVEMPTADGDGTPEFYEYRTRPHLRRLQERYVRKMIDETILYDHVIYEIENEHWDTTDGDFARHYAELVKAHIAAQHPRSPRLVSYSSLEDDLELFYSIDAVDIVNRHYGNEAERDPDIVHRYLVDRWHHGKAINIDEFANGVTDYDLLRRLCWTIVTSGGHFHIEDSAPASRPFDVTRNLRAFVSQSGWRFVRAAPDDALVTRGRAFCMAERGVEVVCYLPMGGNVTVATPTGTYEARFWNPRAGGFLGTASVNAGASGVTVSPPGSGDFVLQLRRTMDGGVIAADGGTPSRDGGIMPPDAGTPASDAGTRIDAGTGTDAGVVDAGTPLRDAGAPPAPDAGTATSSDGGAAGSRRGGCSTSGDPETTSNLLWWVALASVLARRRRRASLA